MLDSSHPAGMDAPPTEFRNLPATTLKPGFDDASIHPLSSRPIMQSTDTIYTCIDHFCVTSETPKDPHQGAHVLDLALHLADELDRVISMETKRALRNRVHARLAAIVSHDKGMVPEKRIDAIRANDAGPTPRMWTIFKDLNPRHLSIIGGYSENCYFAPLQSMTTWNRLESIYLGGICSPGSVFRLPPFVLRTLKSLELHMCLDMDLRAVGGAAPILRLENLEIHSNDVGASAAMLLKNFPSIKRSLTRLAIHSTGCGYDTEQERTGIRRMLTECTKLTDLKLTLRLHHAVQIAGFLPPDVQRIEFAGERSMAFLPLIDDWIARAKDPKWAPNLRFLKFTVDRDQFSMPERFFLTKVRGKEDEDEELARQTMEELMAIFPPGVTFLPVLPPQNRELFDDNDSPNNDDYETGFDADTDLVSHAHVFNPVDEADATNHLDAIDLDNLPGIGPHPDHVPKKRDLLGNEEEIEDGNATWRRTQKARSVGDEALADFEKAFLAKKEELYKILKYSKSGIELV